MSTVEDHPGGEALFKPKRAVLYLRVSTMGQVNTDYDPEGISIPTQRAKGEERALSLGAEIVETFIEPGRTATTIDGRKEFARMMAFIRADKHIDYLIVFARSRLFRNSIDAAITKRELRKFGTVIISILDYTEDTPVGDLVATVLDAVNEYQSKAQGADISLKMASKAQRGGVVGPAKLGYLNVKEKFEGREVATIARDPERWDLVLMGFELYATGVYGLRQLRDTLTDAGLRTRPSGKYPAGTAVSIHKLGTMLRDPFYLGVIRYKGTEYPGRHEPMVSRELFDRVQEVLNLERGGGTRARKYSHYLKGSIWCPRCKSRYWYVPGKSKTGRTYFYFMCSGRQRHICDMPYLQIDQVERAVEEHYASVTLGRDLRALITASMRAAVTDSASTGSLMRGQLAKQVATLDAKIDALLELVGDPDWPNDRIKMRMGALREEKAKAQRQLDQLTVPDLDAGQAALTALLELLGDAQRLYRVAGQAARKVLNQTFFTRIYIDSTDGVPYVTGDELIVIVQPLIEVQRDRSKPVGPQERGDEDDTSAKITPTVLLANALGNTSSGKSAMVGRVGLEPTTQGL